jgi:hypothetical protein
MRLVVAGGGEVGLCRNDDLRGGAVHVDTVGLLAQDETLVGSLIGALGLKYGW